MGTKRKQVAVWFEIPAENLDRAAAFYEKVLDTSLKREDMEGEALAVFSYEPGSASGCVMQSKAPVKPGPGILIYLNCDGMLNGAVERVVKAGGKLRTPVIQLPGNMGSFIHIEDTEGNLVGLHAID